MCNAKKPIKTMNATPRIIYPIPLIVTCCLCLAVQAQTPIVITSFTSNGQLTWADSGYINRLYTVEWSGDLTRWTNTWNHLWLQSVSGPTNTVTIPMFYRVSAIPKNDDKLPPSPEQLVGMNVAIIAYGSNPNLRVEFATTTNGFFQGLDSGSPPRTAAAYVYQVLDKTTAFLRVTWPGNSIEGQMHFYTRSAGTLDQSLGKGFFILQ